MQSRRYVSAGLILALAAQAAAQAVITQYGRALDANLNVITGRINSIRQADRAVDGNRYVTGQVTSGFHFRGTAGYVASDQLRLDLPSSQLDNFIRGSTGVEQTGPGRTYGPSMYLSASRTVLAPSAIARGLNRPGSSAPRATYVPPTSARKLYDGAMEAYKPILPNMGNQLRINPLIQPQVSPDEAMSLRIPKKTAESEARAYRPATSSLFGIARGQDQQHPPEGADQAQPADRPGERLRPESRLEWQVEGVPSQPKTPSPPDKEKPPLKTPKAGHEKLPGAGQDVFLDLLRALREAKQPEGESREGIAGAKVEKGRQPTLPGVPAAEKLPRPKAPRKLVERIRGQIVIHSLAGSGRDLFNMRMATAQNALANGRYYDAAGHYRVAAALNRGNPLASIGLSLALFAANEPMTSAYHLRRALSQTPPIMEPKVNVKRLLGKQVVDSRIAELERRLSKESAHPDLDLLCLAAFIRAGNDQPEQAAAHAKRLKWLAEKRIAELKGELAPAGEKGPSEVQRAKAQMATNELFLAYSKRLLADGKAKAAPTTRPAVRATAKSTAPKGP